MFIVIFCFVAASLILAYVYIRRKVTHHFPENYPNEANRTIADKNETSIVCFGDSNTHGNVSYNWVADLRKELPKFNVYNAGQNSDLTFSLLRRIDEVIACQPNFITLLIGTNDINASISKNNLKTYQSINKIIGEEHPDVGSFEQNYNKIVDILKSKTKAKICLLTLPMMEENLGSDINKLANRYSEIIKNIGLKNNLDVLPIREGQIKYLENNPSQTKYTFSDSYKIMVLSVSLNYFLGWSWDRICKLYKTQLSPDFLHQNSIAGGMIKETVLNWIKKYE
jgi:lysophospholipase L1-like esterase